MMNEELRKGPAGVGLVGRIWQAVLVRLLHWANASPPWVGRREFYALKLRLLRTYADHRGHDLQHIVKRCWGYSRWNGDVDDYEHVGCTHDVKCKCGGSGIWDQRWVWLERFEWLGFVFHNPLHDTRFPPTEPQPRPIIEGIIEHRKYGRLSNEAALWLYLLCGEWSLLWKTMRYCACCGRYAWPLTNLQRMVFSVRMKLRRRECIYCKRTFFTGGSGWCVCRRCRSQPRTVVDDPPF